MKENLPFSELTRPDLRMSFHKYWASYDLSLNIGSHLHSPGNCRSDPSAAVHRPLLSFKDYGLDRQCRTSKNPSVSAEKLLVAEVSTDCVQPRRSAFIDELRTAQDCRTLRFAERFARTLLKPHSLRDIFRTSSPTFASSPRGQKSLDW